MAPYKVREGLEVEFDFNKITIAEWRKLFDNQLPASSDDEVVSKITGLSIESLGELSMPEWKRLFAAMLIASKSATDPS